MAIINCPHCQAKLRFPDDADPKRVKCPACGGSFLAEVPGSRRQSSAAKSREEDDEDERPRKKAARYEDDEDERPRKKAARYEDDEDERPRKKAARYEDDEDDRRQKKRRNEEEDDFEVVDEDNPTRRNPKEKGILESRSNRSKRPRYDDDDDDTPRRSSRGTRDYDDDSLRGRFSGKPSKIQFKNAKTGTNLLGVGYWCVAGALGIEALLVLISLFATVGTGI